MCSENIATALHDCGITELSLDLSVSRTGRHQAHKPTGLKKKGGDGRVSIVCLQAGLVSSLTSEAGDPWTHASERGKRRRAGR